MDGQPCCEQILGPGEGHWRRPHSGQACCPPRLPVVSQAMVARGHPTFSEIYKGLHSSSFITQGICGLDKWTQLLSAVNLVPTATFWQQEVKLRE